MVCEYISSVRDREVRGLKYRSGSQSFLAIKLESDLIIRAILQVALILRIKLRLR